MKCESFLCSNLLTVSNSFTEVDFFFFYIIFFRLTVFVVLTIHTDFYILETTLNLSQVTTNKALYIYNDYDLQSIRGKCGLPR